MKLDIISLINTLENVNWMNKTLLVANDIIGINNGELRTRETKSLKLPTITLPKFQKSTI